jgi:hypothetical protein
MFLPWQMGSHMFALDVFWLYYYVIMLLYYCHVSHVSKHPVSEAHASFSYDHKFSIIRISFFITVGIVILHETVWETYKLSLVDSNTVPICK